MVNEFLLQLQFYKAICSTILGVFILIIFKTKRLYMKNHIFPTLVISYEKHMPSPFQLLFMIFAAIMEVIAVKLQCILSYTDNHE